MESMSFTFEAPTFTALPAAARTSITNAINVHTEVIGSQEYGSVMFNKDHELVKDLNTHGSSQVSWAEAQKLVGANEFTRYYGWHLDVGGYDKPLAIAASTTTTGFLAGTLVFPPDQVERCNEALFDENASDAVTNGNPFTRSQIINRLLRNATDYSPNYNADWFDGSSDRHAELFASKGIDSEDLVVVRAPDYSVATGDVTTMLHTALRHQPGEPDIRIFSQ